MEIIPYLILRDASIRSASEILQYSRTQILVFFGPIIETKLVLIRMTFSVASDKSHIAFSILASSLAVADRVYFRHTFSPLAFQIAGQTNARDPVITGPIAWNVSWSSRPGTRAFIDTSTLSFGEKFLSAIS
jgi:hypothetical protein